MRGVPWDVSETDLIRFVEPVSVVTAADIHVVTNYEVNIIHEKLKIFFIRVVQPVKFSFGSRLWHSVINVWLNYMDAIWGNVGLRCSKHRKAISSISLL